jgi:hypothetical protein
MIVGGGLGAVVLTAGAAVFFLAGAFVAGAGGVVALVVFFMRLCRFVDGLIKFLAHSWEEQ